jgi:hypothetical protein
MGCVSLATGEEKMTDIKRLAEKIHQITHEFDDCDGIKQKIESLLRQLAFEQGEAAVSICNIAANKQLHEAYTRAAEVARENFCLQRVRDFGPCGKCVSCLCAAAIEKLKEEK